MDIFHTALVTHSLYWYLITNYFRPWELDKIPWSFKVCCHDFFVHCNLIKWICWVFIAAGGDKRELFLLEKRYPMDLNVIIGNRHSLSLPSKCTYFLQSCIYNNQLFFLDYTTCGYGNARTRLLPLLKSIDIISVIFINCIKDSVWKKLWCAVVVNIQEVPRFMLLTRALRLDNSPSWRMW